MAWREEEVKDVDDLVRISKGLSDTSWPFVLGYIFRGQENREWGLQHSLARALPKEIRYQIALDVEQNLLDEFRHRAPMYVNPNILSLMSSDLYIALPVMQHYGAPTRMLDWTRSIFVAAYFACRNRFSDDGAIWLYNAESRKLGRLEDKTIETNPDLCRVDEPEKKDRHLMVVPPSFVTDRMAAQQGVFTVCEHILTQHDILPGNKAETRRKLIIPAAKKIALLRHLNGMNIHASSLFPGLDGVGEQLKETAQLTPEHLDEEEIERRNQERAAATQAVAAQQAAIAQRAVEAQQAAAAAQGQPKPPPQGPQQATQPHRTTAQPSQSATKRGASQQVTPQQAATAQQAPAAAAQQGTPAQQAAQQAAAAAAAAAQQVTPAQQAAQQAAAAAAQQVTPAQQAAQQAAAAAAQQVTPTQQGAAQQQVAPQQPAPAATAAAELQKPKNNG